MVEEKVKRLKELIAVYLEGFGLTDREIEVFLKEEEHTISSIAKEIAQGKLSEKDALERLKYLARTYVKPPTVEVERVEKTPAIRPTVREFEYALEPEVVADRILMLYIGDLLTFGLSYVLENYRGDLGFFDGMNERRVFRFLTEEIRKIGQKWMYKARRGGEYLAAYVLYHVPDIVVQKGIRSAVNQKWGDIRLSIRRNVPHILEKYGDETLKLVIIGFAYEILGAQKIFMPDDVRIAYLRFRQIEG